MHVKLDNLLEKTRDRLSDECFSLEAEGAVDNENVLDLLHMLLEAVVLTNERVDSLMGAD